MKQDDFERLLMDDMSELPPPASETSAYTPWQSAISKIMWGMGLTTFKFEFFYLQYLLPLLGAVLMYLGYRSLRQENKWFKLGWMLSGIRLIWHAAFDVLNATPLLQMLVQSKYNFPLSALLNGISAVMLFALRAGIRAAFASTGEAHPKDWLGRGLTAYLASLAIAVWSELVPLTQPSMFGLDIIDEWQLLYYGRSIAFIVLQIYLLVCISRQSSALAGRGYNITLTPVRFSSRAVLLSVFGTVLIAIPIAMYFGSHIPIGPVEPVTSPLAGETLSTRNHLVKLGMPEEVAHCLDEEELLLCEGATAVRSAPFIQSYGSGENPTTVDGSHIQNTLSDAEVELSSWAVVLPNGNVRYYHHFRYLTMPSLRLQEQFSTDPAGSYPNSDYTSRLLWEKDGQTQTVRPDVKLAGGQTADELPEWSAWMYQTELERLGYYHYSPWFDFSIPKGAENMRGYLAYTATPDPKRDFSDFCHVFLRHQDGFFHYPFCSISDLGGARTSSKYNTIQSTCGLFDFNGILDE